jgi:hypothetical protein
VTQVRRVQATRSGHEPKIHFIERDGVRTYRVWSHSSDEYISSEMSEAELKDWLFCRILSRATYENISESEFQHPQHERDLTDFG